MVLVFVDYGAVYVIHVCFSCVLFMVLVFVDYGAVYVIHVCLELCVVYGVGIC